MTIEHTKYGVDTLPVNATPETRCPGCGRLASHADTPQCSVCGTAAFEAAAEVAVGKKYDGGKPRFTLFPVETLHPILEVLEHGAKKYGEHNWRQLANARERYVDALHRHVIDYLSGVRVDHDSGLRVTAHIACNAIFLLAFDLKERLPDVDKR